MRDKPILFSGAMVRALLAGTKTQTRRVLKPQPPTNARFGGVHFSSLEPDSYFFNTPQGPFKVKQRISDGDRLWVKETWRPHSLGETSWDVDVSYAADGERRLIKDGEFGNSDWNWPKAAHKGNVTPLFMPRWASRLTLAVTDVRVQRLQDITLKDAFAEGCEIRQINLFGAEREQRDNIGRAYFRDIWEHINGDGSWVQNPWVVAYTFTVQRGNIDQVEK